MFRRKRHTDDFSAEINAHLAAEVDRLQEQGLSYDEARAAAHRAFGNITKAHERFYESSRWLWWDHFWRDLLYAVRILRKSPGFTAVAILTLALGIGANTAIFSLMDTVMFRLLPVQRPDELVQVGMMTHGFGHSPRTIYTNPLWESLRARQYIVAGVLAWGDRQFNLAPSGVAEDVRGIYVSGSYFPTLGVRPAEGRLITPDDDRRGCPGVAVLGYGFWQQHFGGAPVAGKTISMDGHPFEIIGVSAAGFFGAEVGRAFDVAAPICSEAIIEGKGSVLDARSAWWLHVLARQKPGVSDQQISARLASISPAIFAQTVPTNWKPSDQKRFLGWTLTSLPAGTGISALRTQYDLPLEALMAIAGFVLMLACTNIASLMLARATARAKEIGVRLALGASRMRLVRQLLTESVLLSCSGALLGILFAQWGSRLVVEYISTGRNKVSLDLTLDTRVLIFTAAAAVLTGLLFGVLPAFRATRVSLAEAMKGAPSAKAEADTKFRAGRWLVAAQLAISLVLVATMGLFVRSFANLVNLDTGFDRHDVLLAKLDLQNAAHPGMQLASVQQEMLRRVRTLPGVISASESMVTPISGAMWDDFIVVEGPRAPAGDDRDVYLNNVTPGYFATLRTRMIEGRDFNEQDNASTPPVAIVNQALARKFFPGMDALGKTFRQYATATTLGKPVLIVGVAGDAKYDALRGNAPPTAYFPLAQSGDDALANIEIRTAVPPLQLTKTVEATILDVNKSAAIQFVTLAQQVDDSLTQERLLATLSGFFGALALLLAMVGFYGVLAYLLLQRRKEIGIRIALGAQRGAILRTVMRDVALLLFAGTAAGLAITVAAAQFIQSLLFDLQARDAGTLALSVALLAAVALAASYIPARRAMRVDPMVALRYE